MHETSRHDDGTGAHGHTHHPHVAKHSKYLHRDLRFLGVRPHLGVGKVEGVAHLVRRDRPRVFAHAEITT